MLNEVIEFWFNDIDKQFWWKKDAEFDRQIATKFGELHRKATLCELYHWRRSASGRLAEVIVLDQFSRNIHRESPQAFKNDGLALALAQEAVAQGDDKKLDGSRRSFLYMPYMHSESLAIHEEAVKLFEALENAETLTFELKHKSIIERFGRYPHRNAILGRKSTQEEREFLKTPGSSF